MNEIAAHVVGTTDLPWYPDEAKVHKEIQQLVADGTVEQTGAMYRLAGSLEDDPVLLAHWNHLADNNLA